MLDAGFTTVRNVGSPDRNDVGLKQASTPAMSTGRGSFRPAMRWARRAATATSTFLPPSLQKASKEEGIGDGPEESASRSAASANSAPK